MPAPYTDITFTNAREGGITAQKLNKLRDDLSTAISGGGGGTGTGDMTKAVYDTNANNVVDTCDSLAWVKLTGIPVTFPPDSTAMLKSVYDINGNGKVDGAETADAVPWTGITGKPATFPPDSTAMLKSVYDTNADNICDHAALADTAPWTGITGKPATFPPSAHAASHLDNGADAIAVVTTTRTGLAPVLSGNTATYLNGGGAFNQVAYANVTGTPTVPAPSSTTPAMDGTAAIGVGTTYARNDHVHPSDTSRYAASNPSGYISANQTITLGGDATGSGATAITTTLATVNANVGTFQGLTVNAKGLVTAASNQNYATSASVPLPSSTTPVMDGTGAVGVGTTYARNDHVHPSDTSRMAVGAAPTAHASSHLDNGSDAIPVATTSRTGSLRALNGTVTTFLDGTGNWSTPAPAGTVNPGTWTNLSYGTGWTQNTTAQYRVETNGSFQQVICQGIINYASGAASLAFTLPAGARPGVTRGCVLAGFDSSGDVLLFSANVSTAGAVTILPMVRQSFVWPSATNGSVYLDNLIFAL